MGFSMFIVIFTEIQVNLELKLRGGMQFFEVNLFVQNKIFEKDYQ